MSKNRQIYKCSRCGASSFQWRGQCPSCGEWNSLAAQNQGTCRTERASCQDKPVPLSSVSRSGHKPYGSGIDALDRVLGSGLVPGAAILLGGEPGIGKSTLLLQVAQAVAVQGKNVLYASGEESLPQIRARAERLGDTPQNLLGLATSSVEHIIDTLGRAEMGTDLLIVDSVQTLTSQDAEGLPGNVSQVRAVATRLLEACRNSSTTLFLVGHVTKDGVLAGPRLLEHMVDTVVSLEGDRRQMFRLLRVFKNRFGPNEELLVFRMEQEGMKVVDDPSTFFLGERNTELSGTAVAMALDGRRPLAVEIQALAARTFLNIPRRSALGFDVNRLNLLLAVLEKRLKLNFSHLDIYAKIGGGIKIAEPAMDLALVSAILSSFYDMPLPPKSVFWGEVDLNGQIRPVSGQGLRIGQAQRLAFAPIFHPPLDSKNDSSNTCSLSTLSALQKKLFSRI